MGGTMYRFLLTRRWILGHVLLVVTVITFVNLGFWQLRRLDERRDLNALVTQRLEAEPVALDELEREVGQDVGGLEYRRVTVSGHYRSDDQLLTAPRSRDGQPGPVVLTVLQRDAGSPVLIERGWVPFNRDVVTAPAPPGGTVRVEGIVRGPEPGAAGDADQVAQIVPAEIAERIGQPLPPYYVQLLDQRPAAAGVPLPATLPEITEGSHLSYALQWFGFALIALIGYPALAWRTARERAAPEVGPDVRRTPPAPVR